MRCPTLAELPPPLGKTGWPWTIETPRLPDTMPDGQPWPRISIVTPSYNQDQFIEETIRSVLLQGYSNLEYIIIDGGSEDNSVAIIKKYEPWLAHWTSESDSGQSEAINKGFRRSTGSILSWLNSDDFLALGALERIAEAFDASGPATGAVVGRGHKIDDDDNPYYSPLPEHITSDSLHCWCQGANFMQPACFFSREAFDQAGPIREDLHYCMDLALWISIARDFKFRVIDEDLAYIHAHPSAKTMAQRPLMFGETALLFASTPGGFGAGRSLLFTLLGETAGPSRRRHFIRQIIPARLRGLQKKMTPNAQ